jgi:YhcH/YjgK/YiaL family protein
MIIDSLENISFYASLNPLFEKAVDFIKQNNLESLQHGIIKIDGDDLFVNVSLAKGKTADDAKLETHNKMIDIQIPLSAPETMGYTPRKDLPEAEYNEAKDISFYEGRAQEYVTVYPGMFAIFFPQDGHAPCITPETEIKKLIFKVKCM